MVSDFKKSSIPRQSSYNSLYLNPLTDLKHNRSSSDGGVALGARMRQNPVTVFDDKENAVPNNGFCAVAKQIPNGKAYVRDRALKPSSLQLCMQMNEPDSNFGSKIWDPVGSDNTGSVNIWDYSDSVAAPASSWSTLPNRSLLCRPLPVDIGRCTCVIVKEALPEGLDGGNLYSLYTNTNKIRVELEEKQKQHARLLVLVLAIGVGVMKKMKEKDEQIQRMGKLNWVLQERVKSLYVENQLWGDLVQTNEAAANSSNEEYGDDSDEQECHEEDEEVDVMALRTLVRIERQRANAAYLELEKERLAAATAAEEAMAMILKLQTEKSLIEMEANQYRRLTKEKQLHNQGVIHSLRWIVMKHELERGFLEDQLRFFRQKLKLSMKGQKN